MLRYHWNDFMISAQLLCEKIVVDAVPINVKNISEEEEGIQHIEKAFQGDITAKSLNKEISEDMKPLRSIEKMYEYFSSCINQEEKTRILPLSTPSTLRKVAISRQWCIQQGRSSKKQRLIIKLLLSKFEGEEVKQEQLQWFTIKLNEVYLTTNGLLLKCNALVLSELDYLKKSQKSQMEKMNEIYLTLQKKMREQLDLFKEEMKKMVQSALQKDKDDTTSKRSKKSKNKHHSEDIKYEEQSEGKLVKRSRKGRKSIDKESDQAKTQADVKYQQDQQGKRLKLLQQSQPKQKIIPIPVQFDQQNPAYHFFEFSDKSVKKMGGFDYPMAILKCIIPKQGTHGAILSYIQKKSRRSCCLQIGIIDENIKKLLHSSVSDNYIFFKFNISTVCIKVNGVEKKKRFGKLRVLTPGESVQLRVNVKLGIICWAFSYGETVRVEIPMELRKMNLQPFVGIFTTGDMVRFQDYPCPE